MAKEITKLIVDQEWYQALVEDCQAILVEGIWNYRLTLIKTYHLLGQRILEEKDNFTKAGYLTDAMSSHVSASLGKSQRTIERAIQFVKKYPNLDLLPEGKNISWHKICNFYLPEPKEKTPPLPKGKYQVIYADPPWPYPERQDEKNLYGNTKYHYETMSIKEISELKVGELADKNSVLFLWVATNFLEESFEILKSWGFEYKSNMVWIKTGKKSGIGYYVRGFHELLLIAIKGSFLPKTKEFVKSVIEAPVREHSRKPDEVYEIIEKLYPNCRYLELFARNNEKRPEWTYWGDQADEN